MAKKVRRATRARRRRREPVREVRRQEFTRVERDLEIQFRRIAQIQAELDEIKRAISRSAKD